MNSLIIEEIEKYDTYGNIIGFIEMKTITLYDKSSSNNKNDFVNYNKDDIPFLCFEEYDENTTSEIGQPCLSESFRIKITDEEAKKFKQFISKNQVEELYNNNEKDNKWI